MSETPPPGSSRRDFLTGRAIRSEIEWVGEQITDELLGEMSRAAPQAGPTVRLGTRAMATEFVAILNPGPAERFLDVSAAMEILPELELEMTVYRAEGELARANRAAASSPVAVSPRLFDVLELSMRLAEETGGACDPTSGPLIALWKACRNAQGIPDAAQLAETLAATGIDKVALARDARTLHFRTPGVQMNLGGIGKGFALDRVAERLKVSETNDWLLHGGKSSLLASGQHAGREGWPVGIRHPLFPNRRLGTILLRDRGMSTSGSGAQFFRHEGKRYGHILDPRTGMPAEGVLSVTVLAPTAAVADALSTGFFVMGLEKTREYCDNHQEVTVLLTPPPTAGSILKVHAFNLPEQTLYLSSENELIEETE